MPRHIRENRPAPVGAPPVIQYQRYPEELFVTTYGAMGTVPDNHINFMLETQFTYLASVSSINLFTIPGILSVAYNHQTATMEFTRNPGATTQNTFRFDAVTLPTTSHILFVRRNNQLTLLVDGLNKGQFTDFWYRMKTGILTSTDNSGVATLSFSRWSPFTLEEAEIANFADIQAA